MNNEKITLDEMVSAVKLLKETCKEYQYCGDCPLYSELMVKCGLCSIWDVKLKENNVPRIFI